jgi:hypothetical protein
MGDERSAMLSDPCSQSFHRLSWLPLLEFYVAVRRSFAAGRYLAFRVVVLRTDLSSSCGGGRHGNAAANGGIRALDFDALYHPGERDAVPDKERMNVRALFSWSQRRSHGEGQCERASNSHGSHRLQWLPPTCAHMNMPTYLVFAAGDPLEVVQVQLPLEGREVPHAKVPG